MGKVILHILPSHPVNAFLSLSPTNRQRSTDLFQSSERRDGNKTAHPTKQHGFTSITCRLPGQPQHRHHACRQRTTGKRGIFMNTRFQRTWGFTHLSITAIAATQPKRKVVVSITFAFISHHEPQGVRRRNAPKRPRICAQYATDPHAFSSTRDEIV